MWLFNLHSNTFNISTIRQRNLLNNQFWWGRWAWTRSWFTFYWIPVKIPCQIIMLTFLEHIKLRLNCFPALPFIISLVYWNTFRVPRDFDWLIPLCFAPQAANLTPTYNFLGRPRSNSRSSWYISINERKMHNNIFHCHSLLLHTQMINLAHLISASM